MDRCPRCYAKLVRDVEGVLMCLICGSGRYQGTRDADGRGALARIGRTLRALPFAREIISR